MRIGRAGPGWPHPGSTERLLHPNTGGTGKYPLMPRLSLSQNLVRRILRQDAAEIRLRAEVAGRRKGVQSEVIPLRAFQRIVPLVMDKRETRAAHAGRQRQQRKFTGSELRRKMACLDSPEVETIGNRIWARASAGLGPGAANLLPQVDLALQSLRRECGDIVAIVVEDRVDELPLVAVEKLWDGVTD